MNEGEPGDLTKCQVVRDGISEAAGGLRELGLWQDYEFARDIKGQTGPVLFVTGKNARGLKIIIDNDFEAFFDLANKVKGRTSAAEARSFLDRLRSGMAGHNWCELRPGEKMAFVFRRTPAYRKNPKYDACYVAAWQPSWKLLGAEKNIQELFEAEFEDGDEWHGGHGNALVVLRLDDVQLLDFRSQSTQKLVTDLVFSPATDCTIDKSAPGGGVCWIGDEVFSNQEMYGSREPILIVSNPATGSMWEQFGLQEMPGGIGLKGGYNSPYRFAARVR